MAFQIELLPAFADNYLYLISDAELGLAMAVDPGDGAVVSKALRERNLYLALILITHHHSDHVGGIEKLVKEFGAPVIGPEVERSRIPQLTRSVRDGDTITFSTLQGKVMETHGHTAGHVSYYFPELKALFCGDTLFALGCGRLFEGTAAAMWASLKNLRALPDDTLVYCAHEYTESNAQFALAVDKTNEALQVRAVEIGAMRKAGKPTVPSLLGLEKLTNPFLRVDDKAFQKNLARLGLAADDADAAAVFGGLRSAKDRFGKSGF